MNIFDNLFNGPNQEKEEVSDRAIEGAIILISKIGTEADKTIIQNAETIKKSEEALKATKDEKEIEKHRGIIKTKTESK